MNIVKNMEAVVIAAVAMTFVTALATAKAPAVQIDSAPSAAAAAEPITTVVVTGKRLSAQEKINDPA